MKEIISALEGIEKAAKSGDQAKAVEAIRAARKTLSGTKDAQLVKLDGELEIWQAKIGVIFKEPVGREGMGRHAKHWVDELRKINA